MNRQYLQQLLRQGHIAMKELNPITNAIYWQKLCLIVFYLFFAHIPLVNAVVDTQPNKQDLHGTLVVVNKLGNDVSLIDIASKKVIKSLPTGKGPHELAITKDGKWAVSTGYVGGNSLTVFDVVNAKPVRTISLAKYPRPHGI